MPSDWLILTVLSTLCQFPHLLSIRWRVRSGQYSALSNQQEICLVNLAHRKDIFVIHSRGFGKKSKFSALSTG